MYLDGNGSGRGGYQVLNELQYLVRRGSGRSDGGYLVSK
jgi:hypothetical protein